jgi:hypothetical protein
VVGMAVVGMAMDGMAMDGAVMNGMRRSVRALRPCRVQAAGRGRRCTTTCSSKTELSQISDSTASRSSGLASQSNRSCRKLTCAEPISSAKCMEDHGPHRQFAGSFWNLHNGARNSPSNFC